MNEFSTGKPWMISLQDKKGCQISNRKDIVQSATDYFRKIYRGNNENSSLIYGCSENVPHILPSEVRAALASLKSSKAPDEESWMKHSKQEEELTELCRNFNEMLDQEALSALWSKGKIVVIHKKGCRCTIDNYRPTSLICKLFSSIISRWITPSAFVYRSVERIH